MTTRTTAKFSTDIRRDQIAAATLKVIALKGVGALTTSAIAREVGISEASLYRHFKGKDEILAVTVQKIVDGLRRNLENVTRLSPEGQFVIRLKRLFMLHLDYIEKNGGIPRLIFSDEIHLNKGDLKERLSGAINEYTSALESIIRQGQKAGQIIKELNPGAAALTIIGMVQVTAMRWSLSAFSFPLVAEGMKLWTNYEKSIRSRH